MLVYQVQPYPVLHIENVDTIGIYCLDLLRTLGLELLPTIGNVWVVVDFESF